MNGYVTKFWYCWCVQNEDFVALKWYSWDAYKRKLISGRLKSMPNEGLTSIQKCLLVLRSAQIFVLSTSGYEKVLCKPFSVWQDGQWERVYKTKYQQRYCMTKECKNRSRSYWQCSFGKFRFMNVLWNMLLTHLHIVKGTDVVCRSLSKHLLIFVYT